jgi:protease PrsW
MTAASGAPQPTSEQLERRERAIAESGWGQPFRLVQPHNLAFWVWAAGIVFGAWSMVHLFAPELAVASQALKLGALIAAGYGLLLWAFFRSIDRYDRLPRLLLVAAFLWGGLAATFGIAITGNDANLSTIGKLFGLGFANDWGAALSAPFTEELSKGAGFLLLLTLAPRLLHSPRAALVTGAFIGLGFQILEDDLYTLNGAAGGFFADQSGSVIHMAALRMASGLISHPAYTAIFSVGLLYVVGSPAVGRNVPRGLLFMAIALVIHGTWDGATAIGDSGPLVFVVMLASSLLALGALLAAFRISVPYEQRWMRDILDPEIAAGNLSAEEVDAAAGTRRARRHFVKEIHGHRARNAGKHVLEATIDLAHALAESGGRETDGVTHARAEVVRLRGAETA